MFTEKMYQEIMTQQHGDWADFFMDNSLEHDDDNSAIQLIPTTNIARVREPRKSVNSRFNALEVA